MTNKSFILTRNKTTLALLVLALVIGGISAQATGLLNLSSSGYLVCVNPKTSVVTHPSTSKCPKGFEKLVIGEQGDAGTVGLNGAAGLVGSDGKNGTDGKNGIDGKTLWSGTTDPVITLGAPGDIFINSATRVLFGPKDLATGWPVGVSILGSQGVKGETGSQGATGATGSGGANGANGAAGANGANGATGSNGTNGTVGTNGSYGLSCAQGGTCAVGSTGPGGGIVFYVQTATAAAPWRYLEAAPNTWSGGTEDPFIRWCSNQTEAAPNLATGLRDDKPTLDAIGAGYTNTRIMLIGCAWGAANAAAAYNGGGKSDWHLPSKNELNELYSKKSTVGGFAVDVHPYWTSSEGFLSEDQYNNSYRQYFSGGQQSPGYKNELYRVRPIRAF
jgi:hypothetical protein